MVSWFPTPLIVHVIGTMHTVNVLKLQTRKIIIFFAVRNFRNYVYEKMLVFEILECGLYHEKKLYICMSKCGGNLLETR